MNLLVITHVLYRNDKAIDGPYSSVVKGLKNRFGTVTSIRIPLQEFKSPIVFGKDPIAHPKDRQKQLRLPQALGEHQAIKYVLDFFAILALALKILLETRQHVVIGIDPLSTLPLTLLKPFFRFKLIFYSVDFNEKRFNNTTLQSLYELADKYSSLLADQVWGVCDALNEYKKRRYGVKGLYIPNSFPFNKRHYVDNKDKRTGTKAVWTGSILTNRQIKHIMRLCKKIQQLRPEMEFWFIPTNKIDIFRKEIAKTGLKNTRIYDIDGRKASLKLVSLCDMGIAIYDKSFGSTKYIEPIKIWEYMMCGLPFIISREPSLNKETGKSGVALLLDADNRLPKDSAIGQFISNDNIIAVRERCVWLAKKHDAAVLMSNALKLLIR